MNLIRLIAIAAILWLIYRIVRNLLNPPARKKTDLSQAEGGAMVRCFHCNLHIPRGEALEGDGQWYCCPEHRDMANKS